MFFLSRIKSTKLCSCESLKNIEIKTDACCLIKTEWIKSKLSGKCHRTTYAILDAQMFVKSSALSLLQNTLENV